MFAIAAGPPSTTVATVLVAAPDELLDELLLVLDELLLVLEELLVLDELEVDVLLDVLLTTELLDVLLVPPPPEEPLPPHATNVAVARANKLN